MEKDLFFNNEIPALESDKEGKLKGGFSALGGISYSDKNSACVNAMECITINNACHNWYNCVIGEDQLNKGCTNTCLPEGEDLGWNRECANSCKVLNDDCSEDEKTTLPNKNRGIGFSIFDLGSSALF